MRCSRALLLSCLSLCSARPAAAQAFLGRILDDASGSHVALASVALIDGTGKPVLEVIADTAGRFRVVAPQPGLYSLRVAALGYKPTNTQQVRLDARIELRVELRLNASAVPVEPLRVVARRDYTAMRHRDFYKRAEWSSKTGFGDVLGRADIERMRPPSIRACAQFKIGIRRRTDGPKDPAGPQYLRDNRVSGRPGNHLRGTQRHAARVAGGTRAVQESF